MQKAWGCPGGIGNVYLFTDADQLRVGNCDWRPSPGDLCVRIQHSGDCFHDYVALRKRRDGRYKRVGSFSAYAFGRALTKLSGRKLGMACAGVPVAIKL